MLPLPPHCLDAPPARQAEGALTARRRRLRFVLWLLPIVWIGAVAAGFVRLWNYASAPGEAGTPPARWPRDSQVVPATDRPTLVMFAHPKCPCTRASIAELARVMTRCGNRVAAHVLFYKPSGSTPEWEHGEGWAGGPLGGGLWQAAAGIPGVQVDVDLDQREAERFAALTSGQVVLYDAGGSLLFQGGLTAVRGHEGDNPGREAVMEWLTAGRCEVRRTEVFGCSLVHPSRSSTQE